jgi:hypothetical protein
MKFLKLLLIFSTIFAVFSRRHRRNRNHGVFESMKNFASNLFKSSGDINKISEKIDQNDHQCSNYVDLLNGSTINKIYGKSLVLDSCTLVCDGFTGENRFELFVNYAKEGNTPEEKVKRLLQVIFEKRWALRDCEKQKKRRHLKY